MYNQINEIARNHPVLSALFIGIVSNILYKGIIWFMVLMRKVILQASDNRRENYLKMKLEAYNEELGRIQLYNSNNSDFLKDIIDVLVNRIYLIYFTFVSLSLYAIIRNETIFIGAMIVSGIYIGSMTIEYLEIKRFVKKSKNMESSVSKLNSKIKNLKLRLQEIQNAKHSKHQTTSEDKK